eukprot:3516088-Pleurochrysis_carterae.AAC.2
MNALRLRHRRKGRACQRVQAPRLCPTGLDSGGNIHRFGKKYSGQLMFSLVSKTPPSVGAHKASEKVCGLLEEGTGVDHSISKQAAQTVKISKICKYCLTSPTQSHQDQTVYQTDFIKPLQPF